LIDRVTVSDALKTGVDPVVGHDCNRQAPMTDYTSQDNAKTCNREYATNGLKRPSARGFKPSVCGTWMLRCLFTRPQSAVCGVSMNRAFHTAAPPGLAEFKHLL
jgi:hypothetical protein